MSEPVEDRLAGEDEQHPAGGILSPAYRRITIGIVSLVFLVAFEAMAVSAAMPVAVRDLDGLSLFAWAFSGFMTASMLATIVSGELSDRIGPLAPLLIGTALFAGGLVVAGIAPHMLIFIGARMLQGLGAGGMVVALMATMAKAYPRDLRPKAFGALSAAWVVPSIIGPSVAGVLAEHASWRLVFLGMLPLVVPPLLLVVPGVRRLSRPAAVESKRSRALLALGTAVGIGLLQYAGQQLSWTSLILVAVSLALLIPTLPRLLPARTLTFGRGLPSVVRMRGMLAGAFAGLVAYVPLMLQEHRGVSPSLAGLSLTVGSLGWSLGSFFQARRKLRISRPRLIRLGAAFVTVGVLLVFLAVLPVFPWWTAPATVVVGGLGMGMAMASMSVLMLDYSATSEQGVNSAAMQLSDSLGNVALVGIAGVLFAALQGGGASGEWTFGPVFVLFALVPFIGFLTAGRLRPSNSATEPGGPDAGTPDDVAGEASTAATSDRG